MTEVTLKKRTKVDTLDTKKKTVRKNTIIVSLKFMKKKNPYMDSTGLPLPGKAEECFAWARKQELARRAKLPPEEVRLIELSEQALAKRMNS